MSPYPSCILSLGLRADRVHVDVMLCKQSVAGQVCLAYRNDGGRVCVVLSLVEKLEMEARLNELIPPASRFGTTFVVRQVRPLARLRLITMFCVPWQLDTMHVLQSASSGRLHTMPLHKGWM